MPDQVPDSIKNERFARLIELQNEITLKKNQALLGRTVRVLCDGVSKNNESCLEGRTEGDRIVIFEGDRALAGSFVNIEITRADTFNLSGKIKS